MVGTNIEGGREARAGPLHPRPGRAAREYEERGDRARYTPAISYGVAGGTSTWAVRSSTWLRSCSHTLGALSLILPGAIHRLVEVSSERVASPSILRAILTWHAA